MRGKVEDEKAKESKNGDEVDELLRRRKLRQ